MMTAIMTDAGISVRMPMQNAIPAEQSLTFIGLETDEFNSYVADSVVYESMISPANQSFCIIKVNDETKVAELKQKVFDNCNPNKWICMSAERAIVMDSGSYIMLCMAGTAECDAVKTAFSEYFNGNMGEVLDKTTIE